VTTIDLKDAAGYFGDWAAKNQEAAVKGLRLAAVRCLGTIQAVIIPSRDPQPVDRGIYRAGWKVQSLPNGAEFYNDSPAAAIIEGGVRASNIKIGRKMLDALAQWAIRKGIVKISGRKKSSPSIWDEAMGIAWAIAKKAKAGKGIHNQRSGGGLQIMAQCNHDFTHRYVVEEVTRQLEKTK
jgi:hypothetical protein